MSNLKLELVTKFSDTQYPISFFVSYKDPSIGCTPYELKTEFLRRIRMARITDYKLLDDLNGLTLLLKHATDRYLFNATARPEHPKSIRFDFNPDKTDEYVADFVAQKAKKMARLGIEDCVTITREEESSGQIVTINFQTPQALIEFFRSP